MLGRVQVVNGNGGEPIPIDFLNPSNDVVPGTIAETNSPSLRVDRTDEQTDKSSGERVVRHHVGHKSALRVDPVQIVFDPLMKSKDVFPHFRRDRPACRFG